MRKPMTVALGHLTHGLVRLERIDERREFISSAQWLAAPGPWLGGFDFPVGLPRERVETSPGRRQIRPPRHRRPGGVVAGAA